MERLQMLQRRQLIPLLQPASFPTTHKRVQVDDLFKVKGLSDQPGRRLPKLEPVNLRNVHHIGHLHTGKNTSSSSNRSFINIVSPLFKTPENENFATKVIHQAVINEENVDDVLLQCPVLKSHQKDALNIYGKGFPVLPEIKRKVLCEGNERAHGFHSSEKAPTKLSSDKTEKPNKSTQRGNRSTMDMHTVYLQIPIPNHYRVKQDAQESSSEQSQFKVDPKLSKDESTPKFTSGVHNDTGTTESDDIKPRLDDLETNLEKPFPKLGDSFRKVNLEFMWDSIELRNCKSAPSLCISESNCKPVGSCNSDQYFMNVLETGGNNNLVPLDLDDSDSEIKRITNTSESDGSCYYASSSNEDTESDEAAEPKGYPVMPWHVLPHPRVTQIQLAGHDGGIGARLKRSLRVACLPAEEDIPVTEGGQFARDHVHAEWKSCWHMIKRAQFNHRSGHFSRTRPSLEHYLMKKRQKKQDHDNG